MPNNNYLTTQINLAITELENDRRIKNPYLSTALTNIKTEITTHIFSSAIKECKDFLYGVFAGIIIGGFVFSSDAHALDLELKLGVSTPIGQQNIHSSSGKEWRTGNLTGNVELATPCFKNLYCSVWHYSLILDNKDYGASGIGIYYIYKFNI